MRHLQARGTAWGMMADFIDRYRSKHGGLTRNTVGLRDVVKGLFGEGTTKEAQALADGIKLARGYLVNRANLAGAAIVRKSHWGWVQKQAAAATKRAGVDAGRGVPLPRPGPAKQ